MKNKKINKDNLIRSSMSHFKIILIYVTACIVGLIAISAVFNGMIIKHDEDLTGQMCKLVAEKMNSSIYYMTKSVEDISNILSNYDEDQLEEAYEVIRSSPKNSNYVSIGIIAENGEIYALDSEKTEIEKWNLFETAKNSDIVSISEPYRSSLTGQLVFTLFSDICKDNKVIGQLFITYSLEEIQSMAYTMSLDNKTDVWIMDAYSDNIIRCSGSNGYLIGSWSNMKLTKKDFNGGEYKDWEKSMLEGNKTAAVTYNYQGVDYTQVYEKIDFMDGWYVVVRIPSDALSNFIRLFRLAIFAFTVILIIATAILMILSHKKEVEEKKIFENLSIYDPLTNIMNRRSFEFSVKQFFDKPEKVNGALVFLDVDFFKQVNDTYGHEAGDFILVKVAENLSDIFGTAGIVSRYGGDEFVMFIKNKSKSEIDSMMQTLQMRLKEIKIENAKVPSDDFELHFSAGLAQFPVNGNDYKSLVKCADIALYTVKENGRNNFGWFSE